MIREAKRRAKQRDRDNTSRAEAIALAKTDTNSDVIASTSSLFSLGDTVRCRYQESCVWLKGEITTTPTVTGVAASGVDIGSNYDVTYDDGRVATSVSRAEIRLIGEYEKGDEIQAKYEGGAER